MKIIFVLTFLTLTLTLNAQLFNGNWKGTYADPYNAGKMDSLVFNLEQTNDIVFTGSSHLYYKNKNYEHHTLIGKFKMADSSILITETMIFTTHNASSVQYKFKLKKNVDKYRMEGVWKYKDIRLYNPLDLAWVEKYIKTDKLVKPILSGDKPKRNTEIQQFLEISKKETDSIKIDIYDNGSIDNDSISVYFNETLMVKKNKISEKAVSFFISLNQELNYSKIKMYAENLGDIPPNTALMIITTKLKRYEVRLSSNFEKNAAIEFILVE